MENKAFKYHKIALWVIFIMSSAVISFPTKGANEFTFLAFLVSAAIMLLLWFVLNVFCDYLNDLINKKAIKFLIMLLLILVAVYTAFLGADTFKETIIFISQVILPKTKRWIIVLIFGGIVAYCAFKGQKCLMKLALICSMVVVSSVLFFFFASLENYTLNNIFIFKFPTLKELFSQMKPYLQRFIFPIIILLAFSRLNLKEKGRAVGLARLIIAALITAFCILMPLLLFGTKLSGRLDFPFISAVSTVTVGSLFTRLDGFAYFVLFISSLLKIVVCILVEYVLLKELNKIIKRTE